MGLDSKKDVHLDGSTTGSVSRLEILEGPSGRRVRSEAERARIVAESLLPGAQVSEVARKHGATRWQIYDWRRRFRHSLASLLPLEPAPSPAVDVPEALKAGWLELWYQQKIHVRTLVPSGAEALIRMRHPAWGAVPPAYFIPDESDPHFHALSEFVIARAIEDWRYLLYPASLSPRPESIANALRCAAICGHRPGV
ncbi:transposase-like protein [Bradyrhizobium diazoefficiens]